MLKKVLVSLTVLLALGVGYGYLASVGTFGRSQTRGEIVARRLAPERIAERETSREEAARAVDAPGAKQILFGDLHVHTTYSFDAYSISLPMYQGEGAHPPADACDFARYCAELDFWSINDHAEGLTPRQWSETKEMVRECNAAAGRPEDPDLVTFLGWEWTQIGETAEKHYGHKNVVLLDTAESAVPARPIASREQLFPGDTNPYNAAFRLALIAGAPGGERQRYHDFARFLQDRAEAALCEGGLPVRELPSDCRESASTPGELFEKLDEWAVPYLVIPHGNTWGFYTPALTSWDKQLRDHEDPERHEFLIEVFSGHGNIEEFRSFTAVVEDEDGTLVCPAPTAGYVAECWRAGEIIRARCLAEGEELSECDSRAATARAHHVAGGSAGHLTVPGAEVEDWLDAGQCTDCYMPAYNHRPKGSVQYALTLRDFSEDDSTEREPKRFRFGLIGSSDVHTARPGTGYKESARRKMSDAGLGLLGPPPAMLRSEPQPRSIPPEELRMATPYFERFASFFGAGGLVGVHSEGRDRHSIWASLSRKEVYGTSGDRILLWFDLVDDSREGGERRIPMGSNVSHSAVPHFEARAVGAFEQKPGCPADTIAAVSEERLERLCAGECYHPSDRRKRIDRIEVVRIRPQVFDGEDVASLIDDPFLTLPCPARADGAERGCRVEFSDPEFAVGGRDSVYYVRAIEEASPTINGGTLRCKRDETGTCIEVTPCRANEPTAYEDDCLESVEERAWSSPIFVDYAGPDLADFALKRATAP